MRKQFLGIPLTAFIVVVSILLVTCLGTLAAWLFTQQNQATVSIRGSQASLWKDANHTIPLLATDTLAFGEVRVGTPSSVVTCYIFNSGTDAIKATGTVTGLGEYLVLSANGFGAIGTATKFYQPATPFVAFGDTNTVGTPSLGASDTTIHLTTGDGLIHTAGVLLIESEKVSYTSTSWEGGIFLILGCTRGTFGTTPAAHATGAAVTFGTQSADVPLAPGGVTALPLQISANEGAPIGGAPVGFALTISATSDY